MVAEGFVMAKGRTTKMKVAIFHQSFPMIGGGERLVLTMAEGLNADIITTDVRRESLKKLGIENINIISLGNTPDVIPLRQIVTTWRFYSCNFSNVYDYFILSGHWAHYASRNHSPNMYYCHSPTDIFYEDYDRVLGRLNWWSRILAKCWIIPHRWFEKKCIRNVEKIVCNSTRTKERIKRHYGRDAIVVPPPIHVHKYKWESSGDYWLSVNRIARSKNIKLQLEVFRNLPQERLKIIGEYEAGKTKEKYVQEVLNLKPDNVEFLGSVSDEELISYYANCKGLINTAVEEGFGMVLVEAMASGKPVVATATGGHIDSVVDGETGFLVKPDVDEIVDVIRKVSKNPSLFKNSCIKNVERFSQETFISKIKEITGLS